VASLQPPPTWAEIVIVNPQTQKAKFNPVWLKWFLDLAQILNESGGTALLHNSLTSIQGGSSSQRYHLTQLQQETIGTDGGHRPTTPAGVAQTAADLYAGSGAPNNTDGSDGDFYFRSDGTKAGNTVIYHKEAGAWVALVTA